MDSRFASLRRLVRLHVNWLTVVLLGKELISSEDLAELKNYGKLALGDEISFIDKAFALGRAQATLTTADYDGLTLDALSRFEKKKYSSAEKLAVRESKLHAHSFIHTIAKEVVAASSEEVTKASEQLVNDVLRTMEDELSIAVAEKKTNKELASRLASVLNKGFKKDWTKFATTELHRAKIRGSAMAIANKVDIYSKADGIDSDVSVVPNYGACKDCRNLYLDRDNNPKVFKLKEMLTKGTNVGAKHTRNKEGVHSYWQAVLPPAHPNCYCTLVYVPPGMTWSEAKLVVSDSVRYNDHITKAVDQGSMSATVKPPGPKSTQGPTIPKTPSVAGLPAPGNVAGPGATPGAQAPKAPTAPKPEEQKNPGGMREGMEACPYGGGPECAKHGGDGAKTHEQGGGVMTAHNEYMSRSGKGVPQESPKMLAAKIMAADQWKIEEHTPQEAMGHLQSSNIIRSKPLGDKAGINKGAQKVWLEGNGPALVKENMATYVRDAHNEAAVYDIHSFFGSSRCPMTGLRTVDGKSSSAQAWLGDHETGARLYKDGVKSKYTSRGQVISYIVDKSEDPDAIKKDLSEICVMDVVTCNQDRHFSNFMMDEGMTEAKAIDHGFSFGRGFDRYKNFIHEGMNAKNMRVKITPSMNERFKNTSLTALTKAAGKVSDWEAAQTYLRMRYAQAVQEEHGHLPFSEFKHSSNLDADYDPRKRESGTEKFEDFAIDFMDKHSNDPSSPEYTAAFFMRDSGVLMDPSQHFLSSPETERKRGDHYAYEKRTRVMKALNESIREGKGDFLQPLLDAASNPVNAKYKDEMRTLSDEFDSLTFKANVAHQKYMEAGRKVTDNAVGRLEGDAEVLDADKEAAFKANEKAKDMLGLSKKKFDLFLSMVRNETKKAHDGVIQSIIPEGHEDTFNRLNSAIDRSQGSRRDKKVVRPTDYSRIRPSKANPAADRESSKRITDDAATAKIEDNG